MEVKPNLATVPAIERIPNQSRVAPFNNVANYRCQSEENPRWSAHNITDLNMPETRLTFYIIDVFTKTKFIGIEILVSGVTYQGRRLVYYLSRY